MINFNKWKKIGKIISPDRKQSWSKNYMSLPTAVSYKNFVRIYFGSRDKQNRSRIGFVDYDLLKKKEIRRSKKYILGLGDLGTFDDNGVMPCSVIKIKGKTYLYYVGWNPRSTVRFSFYSGLAIGNTNGSKFRRYSKAPILERTNNEPYVNASPMVIKIKDKYVMYYVSGEGWINPDLPKYNIKIAISSDGKTWKRTGITAVDFDKKGEHALARPCVIKYKDKYLMWFSKKGENFNYKKNYRFGFAYSNDGFKWKRNDKLVDFKIGKEKFDNKMICYQFVFKFKNRYYSLYNGNEYGKHGVGLAELDI